MTALTLQELRYLVAVERTGSFSRAAAQCFVTQPTLSTQLKKLEGLLGVQLVERTNRSVSLTPVGVRVAGQARRIVDDCDSIVELARGYADPFSEPYRIGIIATLGPYLLPLLLAALEQEMPRLEVIPYEGLTAELIAGLDAHRLDAALIALPSPDATMESAMLFDEPFWLVCPRDHPLAKRRRVRLSELAEQRVLLLSEGHCLRDQALELCGAEAAENAAAPYRATSLETLRQLAAAGYGCTLLPTLALGNELEPEGPLRAVRLASKRAKRTIGLIWRPSFPRAQTLGELAELIRRRSEDWL